MLIYTTSVLSSTRDWQNSVVKDAVSIPEAQRHFSDTIPALTNSNIPTLYKYLLLNPSFCAFYFPLCLYSVWKALGLSLSKMSSEASWNKPRIKQQSPSKQRIRTTLLLRLARLTLYSSRSLTCTKTKSNFFLQIIAIRQTRGKEINAQSHSPAMERETAPRCQRLNYSLNHAGLHPLSASGGLGRRRRLGELGRDRLG